MNKYSFSALHDITSKSDCICVTCTKLWTFANTFYTIKFSLKKIATLTRGRKLLWLPIAHLYYVFLMAARQPCVAVFTLGADALYAMLRQMRH